MVARGSLLCRDMQCVSRSTSFSLFVSNQSQTSVRQIKDSTEEMRALVTKYDRLEFIPLRLEDAFDPTWWSKMGGMPLENDLTISLTAEGEQAVATPNFIHPVDHFLSTDLFVSDSSNLKHADSPVTRLQAYISSLPTQTAIPSAIQTLIRVLLLYTASATGSSHLLLGTSMTSLSISLISSISQGGGFIIREEAQEKWMPKLSARPNGHENRAIRVVRPLQDIGMKECAIWAWWSCLHVVGSSKFPAPRQSIGPLTKGKTKVNKVTCRLTDFPIPLRFHCWTGTRLPFYCIYNRTNLREAHTKERRRRNLFSVRTASIFTLEFIHSKI